MDESDDHMGREMGGPVDSTPVRRVRHPLAQHLYKLASELEQVGIDTERLEDGIGVNIAEQNLALSSHYPLPQARVFATNPQFRQPSAARALAQAGRFLEVLEEREGREPVLISLNLTVDATGNFFTTLTLENDQE